MLCRAKSVARAGPAQTALPAFGVIKNLSNVRPLRHSWRGRPEWPFADLGGWVELHALDVQAAVALLDLDSKVSAQVFEVTTQALRNVSATSIVLLRHGQAVSS